MLSDPTVWKALPQPLGFREGYPPALDITLREARAEGSMKPPTFVN